MNINQGQNATVGMATGCGRQAEIDFVFLNILTYGGVQM